MKCLCGCGIELQVYKYRKTKYIRGHNAKKDNIFRGKKLPYVAERMTGSKHPLWKGGRYISPQGYILILAPYHPSVYRKSDQYVFEHRLIMERHLNRFLKANEIVHHINGKQDDNRIENLKLWNPVEHSRYHRNLYLKRV